MNCAQGEAKRLKKKKDKGMEIHGLLAGYNSFTLSVSVTALGSPAYPFVWILSGSASALRDSAL